MENSGLFGWVIFILFASICAVIGLELGFTHVLSIFGWGAFIILLFFKLDIKKGQPVSKVVKVSFIINICWLIITFLLLPSPTAVNKLNELNIPQTLFQHIFG